MAGRSLSEGSEQPRESSQQLPSGQQRPSGQPRPSSGSTFAVLLEHLRQVHEDEVDALRIELSGCYAELAVIRRTGVQPEDANGALVRTTFGKEAAAGGGDEAPQAAENMGDNTDASVLAPNAPEERPSSQGKSPEKKVSRFVFSTPGKNSAGSMNVDWREVGKWYNPSALVQTPLFHVFFGVMIVLNSIIMAFEAQYVGLDIGFTLGYHNTSHAAVEAWPHWEAVADVMAYIFLMVFTAEILIKLLGYRFEFFLDAWNWVDASIVVVSFLTLALPKILPIQPSTIRLIRLSRLVRLFRIIKDARSLDSLFLMTTALSSSVSILAWSAALLTVVLLLISLVLFGILQQFYFDVTLQPKERQRDVYEYFGTFSRVLITMFEITLGNWPPVCRVLMENVSEWFLIFSIIHKLTIGFAVVGVINGVFMQETFRAAAVNDRIMASRKQAEMETHVQKMEKLFRQVDRDGNGELTYDEFKNVMEQTEVRIWLASMDLDASDVPLLFQLIDNGDGSITAPELVRGMGRLKGPAKSIDLAALRCQYRADIDLLLRLCAGTCQRLSQGPEYRDDGPRNGKVGIPPPSAAIREMARVAVKPGVPTAPNMTVMSMDSALRDVRLAGNCVTATEQWGLDPFA